MSSSASSASSSSTSRPRYERSRRAIRGTRLKEILAQGLSSDDEKHVEKLERDDGEDSVRESDLASSSSGEPASDFSDNESSGRLDDESSVEDERTATRRLREERAIKKAKGAAGSKNRNLAKKSSTSVAIRFSESADSRSVGRDHDGVKRARTEESNTRLLSAQEPSNLSRRLPVSQEKHQEMLAHALQQVAAANRAALAQRELRYAEQKSHIQLVVSTLARRRAAAAAGDDAQSGSGEPVVRVRTTSSRAVFEAYGVPTVVTFLPELPPYWTRQQNQDTTKR